MELTKQEKTYADYPRITHSGKYGVLYDAAYTEDGGLYYGSWTGSKQMCEGIAAALLDSGKRNQNSIYLNLPLDGKDGVWSRSLQVRVAENTVGAMRRKTERVRDTRAWQVVLRSELIRWDYSYVHLQSKNAIEKKDDSEYEKTQADNAQRRFVLMADADEEPFVTAQRWFGYLPKRVSEPLLPEWAQPLWDYCTEEKKGITEMNRLRGRAWLCEPSSDTLRDAISQLGKGGYLELPDFFPGNASDAYDAVAIAAD